MRKLLSIVAVVAAVTAVALGGIVATDSASAAERELSGTGVLYARGSGIADLRGDGVVDIKAHGVGTVVVCGAERIEARGAGQRAQQPDGCVRFAGWKGAIHLVGEDMAVHMEGTRIEFRAAGHGVAHLKGHGVFKVGSHSGRWTPEGVDVRF